MKMGSQGSDEKLSTTGLHIINFWLTCDFLNNLSNYFKLFRNAHTFLNINEPLSLLAHYLHTSIFCAG